MITGAGFPDYYTANQVADMVGVSTKTIYELCQRGCLRGRAPRGMTRPILFRMQDIREWLDGGDEVERR